VAATGLAHIVKEGGVMPTNRGTTSLKRKRRPANPMRDFDHLPPELRIWLSNAALPWRPRSVRRAFDRALARTRDRQQALEQLDALENRLIAKDACFVWGKDYPLAGR
jgi:hypothetical protein